VVVKGWRNSNRISEQTRELEDNSSIEEGRVNRTGTQNPKCNTKWKFKVNLKTGRRPEIHWETSKTIWQTQDENGVQMGITDQRPLPPAHTTMQGNESANSWTVTVMSSILCLKHLAIDGTAGLLYYLTFYRGKEYGTGQKCTLIQWIWIMLHVGQSNYGYIAISH